MSCIIGKDPKDKTNNCTLQECKKCSFEEKNDEELTQALNEKGLSKADGGLFCLRHTLRG